MDANAALFERYVAALQRITHVPGISGVILRNGRPIWHRDFGYANVEARVPATSDTLYDIASLTKTFTSTLLLQCVERGTLSLDDRMSRYTTAIPEPTATVRHVLSHTSKGTPGAAYAYDGNRFAALTAVVDACQGAAVPSGAGDGDSRSCRDGRIGPRPRSRAAVTSAGGAVRRADARALRRFSEAAPRCRTSPSAQSAHPVAPPPRDISASAGLLSSTVDLAKYDLSIDADVFISRASQELAWTNTVSTTGQTLPYGLGWFIQREHGVRLVWHYGQWPQYSALYLKAPERGLTLILLANSGGLGESYPLADGDVMVSPFAKAFVRIFIP